MKKLLYKSFMILSLVLVLVSCEENEIPIIDESYPTLAQFNKTTLVIPTPEEGSSREVEVIVSTVSSMERTVNLSIDPESTASSDQYTISDLVIPANSYTGTFTISGNFNSLPESGSSNLIIKIEDVNGEDTLIEKGTLNVEFFRQCDIIVEEYVGTWSGTTSWGYDTEVVTSLSEDGQLMITGLTFGWLQDAWGEVIIDNEPLKMDIDPETGEITIEEQYYVETTYNGAVQPKYNMRASGMVLNSCEKVIEINPVLVQPGLAGTLDGSAYGPAFQEVITLVE